MNEMYLAKIDDLIDETKQTREFHRTQYRNGVKGAKIEVLACNIRIKALEDAKAAIKNAGIST